MTNLEPALSGRSVMLLDVVGFSLQCQTTEKMEYMQS